MKTQEQNTKEVMTYLEKSSQNFFQSEDGKNWQAVVFLHSLQKYVFVKDGHVFEFNMAYYIGEGITEGKTRLKQKLHPTFDCHPHSAFYHGYGHGPSKKLRAVKFKFDKYELTAKACQDYLEAQTEKGSV